VEIEDLVLGTLEPARARELRAHVASCAPCRVEEAALHEERALFTHREACVEAPSPALAAALRARLEVEVAVATSGRARPSVTGSRIGPARRGATRLVRRGASVLAGVLRRGHVSAACAAALFAFVAFSKLGSAPLLPQDDASAFASEPERAPGASRFESIAEETLACTEGGQPTAFSSALVSAGAAMQLSSSSGSGMPEVLACGTGSSGSKSWSEGCDQSVMCSSLRQ
jgi:hypothetical protein